MDKMKQYIFNQVASRNLSTENAKALLELHKDGYEKQDIAIVGMAGRFPGANNLDKYWENLVNGVNCITKFPEYRQKDGNNFDESLEESPDMFGELYKEGGYLDEIDKFDNNFFRVTPKEALLMDPHQRVFLEVLVEAIEDGGYGGTRLYGTNTGVYLGRDHTEIVSKYNQILLKNDTLVLTGACTSILSSRISYFLNLRGPSLVIDTACSSGLVSLHTACNSLLSKETDYALAGGVFLEFAPTIVSLYSIVESEDNTVRTFDRNANGTVWGEGVGAVLLKRLDDAIRDNDNIYAVIKGSAINNDGASNGLIAPNPQAQEDVIIKAWKQADIDPETLLYIETHGTGTVLGDQIELQSITNAFKEFTQKKQLCGIGSLKPAVGHLVAASGMASLIKVVLSIKNKTIPKSLNFEDPNNFVNFESSPIYVVDRNIDLSDKENPVRIGVSSFGFSGTNVHVVVEEPPKANIKESISEEVSGKYEVLTLSAVNEESLRNLIGRYKEFLDSGKINDLRRMCYTANIGRGHYSYRLALIFEDMFQFKEMISYLSGVENFSSIKYPGVFFGKHKMITNKRVKENGEYTLSDKEEINAEINYYINKLYSKEYSESDNKSLLTEILMLHVKCGDIDWKRLYADQNIKIARLPVYPFERIRFWPEPHVRNKSNQAKEFNHPLVDKLIVSSINQDIYLTQFEIKDNWILQDHVVLGQHVIPGVTYIELIRELARKYFQEGVVELRDLVFLTPLAVYGDTIKSVHTVIDKKGENLDVIIASQVSNDDTATAEWETHVKGRIVKGEKKQPEIIDINKLISEFDIIESDNSNLSLERFTFGLRWRNIEKIYRSKNDFLVEIKIPPEATGDLSEYVFHPALLDNAVNAVSQDIGDGMYLPFSFGSITIYDKMPGRFYSYIRLSDNSSKNSQTFSFDISFYDLNGILFCEIEHYTIKKVNNFNLFNKSGANHFYHELRWIPYSLIKTDISYENTIVVFRDKNGLADGMIQKFNAQKNSIIEVEYGRAFEKIDDGKYIISSNQNDFNILFSKLKIHNISAIIHLQSIGSRVELNTINDSLEKGIYSLYYLVNALNYNRIRDDLRIFVVADRGFKITGNEKVINPLNASLYGFGKVIGDEHHNFGCIALDVDETFSAEHLNEFINSKYDRYQIAFREGQWFTQELNGVSLENEEDGKVIEINENGVYIITGGTGGIGLEFADYLASKNKVNIILVNRSKFPHRDTWDNIISENTDSNIIQKINKIKLIESSGSSIELHSCNIADFDNLKIVIDSVRNKHGKINGILHAAGIAGDGFINNKEIEKFNAVLTPKIQGSINLDYLTENDNLDFFVTFSSIIAFIGGAGQCDYTSANMFLNSFAEYRNLKNKKTVSIMWPAWLETGMAVQYGVNNDENLFLSIPTQEAIKTFEEIIKSDRESIIVGYINYKYSNYLSIFSENIKKAFAKQKSGSGSNDTSESEKKGIIIEGQKDSPYTANETRIAQVWGEILGVKTINIFDGFYDIGGDSILAVNVIVKLNDRLGIKLLTSDIFDYPTVYELASFVDEKNGNVKKPDDTVAINKVSDKIISDKIEQLPVSQYVLDSISRLSWRELNCFDKAILAALGQADEKLIIYFKMLIGYQRSYNLEQFDLGFDYKKETEIFNYPKNESILNLLGYDYNEIIITEDKDIHNEISSILDGKSTSVVVPVDEFFSNATPYYKKMHTDHRITINGYKNNIYSIVNYHPLKENKGVIKYDLFAMENSIIYDTFKYIKDRHPGIIYVEKIKECETAELDQSIVAMTEFLIKQKQIGSELDFIMSVADSKQYFNEENFNEIYLRLGGKELLLLTISELLTNLGRNTSEISEYINAVIKKSNFFVNSYVASVLKKERLSIGEMEKMKDGIFQATEKVFNYIISLLR
jgi:iturin family lipopeptide synthetase A